MLAPERAALGTSKDLQTLLLPLPSARVLHWLHPKETQGRVHQRAADPSSEGGQTLTRDEVGHGVGWHKQGLLHPKQLCSLLLQF